MKKPLIRGMHELGDISFWIEPLEFESTLYAPFALQSVLVNSSDRLRCFVRYSGST